MLFKPIAVTLRAPMEKDATYLPLSAEDTQKLLSAIPVREEMFLTVQDNLRTEWIKVRNECGTLIVERGIDCESWKFPTGSCVFFEPSLPVVKWLICNYDCCEDSRPECEEVVLQSAYLPAGIVNQEWLGLITFEGSLPINKKFEVPDWVTVATQDHQAMLSGTPTEAGTYMVSYAATNCGGRGLISETLEVQVLEAATSGD